VFEIRPEIMMEAVPLLNEWMIMPWKLKKAHGKEWVVPLETEPEVDIHWKARYNFFTMTMGVAIAPSDMKNGEYTGKLKKDQYIADGRVYQKIPDFLEKYLFRYPVVNGIPQTDKFTRHQEGLQEATREPVEETDVIEPAPVNEIDGEAVEEAVTDNDFVPHDLDISHDDFGGVGDEIEEVPKSEPEIVLEQEPVKKSPPAPVSQPVSSLPIMQSQPATPKTKSESESVVGQVFRWEFKAVPSVRSLNKLHAICILSEGNTPIRIVSPKGAVLIAESNKLKVDPEKFRFLVDLFGLD
jgi:hypothetical protein